MQNNTSKYDIHSNRIIYIFNYLNYMSPIGILNNSKSTWDSLQYHKVHILPDHPFQILIAEGIYLLRIIENLNYNKNVIKI